MDFISTFVASVLFGFFASNYLSKYKLKEEIVNRHLTLSIIISALSEIVILWGILADSLVLFLVGIISFSIILLFQVYVSVVTIKYLDKNKEGKSTFECVAIGINNILTIIGAFFVVIKFLIELLFEGILYNK